MAFPAETTHITLAWDPSEEASVYNLYWRSSPGVTRQNGIKIPTINTPHKLTGLIPGVSYFFVVTAVGENGGESNVSEEISYQTEQ
jgi:fibronectin type 3 domain-containing protein